MTTRRLKSLIAVCAAASMLAPVAGICASPDPEIHVAYGDVNLATPRGIATLYRRLRLAAAEVCGHEPQSREFGLYAAWAKCLATALDEAVVQVPSTGLAALHAKHGGSTPQPLVAKNAPEAR